MARRRTSSRRKAGSPAAGTPAAGKRAVDGRTNSGLAGGAPRGLKPGRDGKYEIACPQCATVYKMPEQLLDAKFACKNCGRTFFPKATGGRRTQAHARSNQTKPFIIGGIALVVLIIIGAVVSSMGGSRQTKAAARDPVAQVPTGSNNPRVAAGIDWVTAITNDDSYNFRRLSDLESLKARLNAWPDRAFRTIGSSEYGELATAILDAIEGGEPEAASLLALDPPRSGSIDPALATAQEGEISLSWNVLGKEGYADSRGKLLLTFTTIDGTTRIKDWAWGTLPARLRTRGEGFQAHDAIAAPKEIQRDGPGGSKAIYESEIVPLPHLEDTPTALRAEIDRLVDLMIDPSRGGNFNRGVDGLTEIGRPAIPRVLNKMYELHGDLDGNNIQLSQLARCLRVMTGAAYAYPVGIEGSAADRLSSLKQWYAFWYRYHKGEYDELIDKSDDPLAEDPPTDPDKKRGT